MQYSDQTGRYPREWRRASTRATVQEESRKLWKKTYRNEPASVGIHVIRIANSQQTQEQIFERLAETWRRETAIHSSLIKKVMHPAYQRIIGMGPVAIPLILRQMKSKQGHWFWALDAITQGQSPTQDWKTLEGATQAWIRWGEENGYL